jgi:hypothetical protein
VGHLGVHDDVVLAIARASAFLFSLIVEKPAQAHDGSEFQRFRLLPAGDRNRATKTGFDFTTWYDVFTDAWIGAS